MEAQTRKVAQMPKAETVTEVIETLFVLIFIVNGLATTLLLMDMVQASDRFRYVVGAIAFAFTAITIVVFTFKGVKHQNTTKKRK